MFDYGNANEAQREAINSTNGLVLITAGPGTGKTFTLVKRAVYLIQECGVKPEQIMMATFTEKAAKELITRITNELAKRDISANVNEMYIGTFHSLCMRIIKEHLEFTRLKRNYRLLDTFDQKYLVFRNFYKFKNINGIDELLSRGGTWKRSDEICNYANHLSEEMVDIEALQSDKNPNIRTLGDILKVYQEMLEEGNLIDFSTIQTECYRLLTENKQILEELQNKLQYLMIDEYQDTNYIQEQIVFLLGAKYHNICVVGDDDQGLYRFRGATIRNILEFPYKFEGENCNIIPLVVNYRSNSDIVDFYNEWMSTTSGAKFKFDWEYYSTNRGKIRSRYNDLTKKFLAYNDRNENSDAFLREPQFEALEMYVFVKEFMNNAHMYQMFDEWRKRENRFADASYYTIHKGSQEGSQIALVDLGDEQNEIIFKQMKKYKEEYPNYIYALTMGLGKTILMATCIFYEFLLAKKYPKDKRFCHNALVFAPDKTVLESLREIMTFDKTKVVPPEYARVLDQNIKFHFLEETGVTLHTIDDSDFNIVISNNQKIIVKKKRKADTPTDVLFGAGSLLTDVYGSDDDDSDVWDDASLMDNQRFKKLCRLPQLGVYVDEAHHLFGANLEKELRSGGANKTTLRNTINMLAASTSIGILL